MAPTVKQVLARAIVDSPNSRFPSNFTGGSARAGLEALARGEKAYVPVTGGYTDVDIRILGFLYEACQHGVVYINCLTNGRHMVGSRHYVGQAVDVDLLSYNVAAISGIARRFGGERNNESDHAHYDFWGSGGLPSWFKFTRPDPLAPLLKDEHDWVREYIKLAALREHKPRRGILRFRMRSRMHGIERKAKQSGWDRENRQARWHILRKYGKG